MTLLLDPNLETALNEQAHSMGMSPEELVLRLLRQHLAATTDLQPRDEWERGLLEAARPWGISMSDADLSRERLYD